MKRINDIKFICFVLMFLIVINIFLLSQPKKRVDDIKKADEYYNHSMEYIQMAQISKAKIMLQRAIELDPDSLKIHRLYQNINAYKDIIEYYKNKYEENKEDPKWVYLYYRLLAKEDMQKGCEKIREAEKKFPDYVYLQLASCTCDVANLNWGAALVGLNNIIRRKDAPVDAYENLLRLYSLSEKKEQLLPTCKEALARYPDDPSIYKLCISYSEDVMSLNEKREILQKAMNQFKTSHQLPEIIFAYARSLNNEAEKISYLKMLWNKYPSNKISINVFPILWSSYNKTDQNELINLAIATLQKDRVGEAMMYNTAVEYILQKWLNTFYKMENLLDTIEITEFNWQGILILLENLIKNKYYIKKADKIFSQLIRRISQEKFISKDYLFRAYISYAKNFYSAKDISKSYEYYKKAIQLREISMTEENWLEYIDLLSQLSKKEELINYSAICYVYNLNSGCYKYINKYIKNKEFANIVKQKREFIYPTAIKFSVRSFDGAEINNSKLNKYNLIYIIYIGAEEVNKLIQKTEEELKKKGLDFSTYIFLISDTEEEAKEYYNTLGLKYPAAFFPQAAELFKVRGIPSVIILDSRSNVLFNKYIEIEKDKKDIVINAFKSLIDEEKWKN